MKKTFMGVALLALLSAATSSAFAQQDGPLHGQGPGQDPSQPPQDHGRPPHDDFMSPRGPTSAAINDLEQLRRLYAMTGHESDMIAVYHDVLGKTQDPMLRHFVYDSLAREQLKPANPDQAIATLRMSLAEDIAAANHAPHGDRPHPEAPPPQPQ